MEHAVKVCLVHIKQ